MAIGVSKTHKGRVLGLQMQAGVSKSGGWGWKWWLGCRKRAKGGVGA